VLVKQCKYDVTFTPIILNCKISVKMPEEECSKLNK